MHEIKVIGRVAAALLLAAPSAAAAQAAGPSAWPSFRTPTGDYGWRAPDGAAELVISKPAKTADVAAFVDQAADAAVRGLGPVVERAPPNRTQAPDGLELVAGLRVVEEAAGRTLRAVVGGELRPGMVSLCRIRVSSSGARMQSDFGDGLQICRQVLGRARGRLASAPVAADPPRPISTAAAPRPAPGQALKAADVAGVYYWHTLPQYNGLTGGLDVRSAVYLFLKDGSVRRGFSTPLEDFDVAASRRSEPKAWGTWKARPGGGFDVLWGPEQRTDFIRAEGSEMLKVCRPSRAGETFDQSFRRTSGTSIGLGSNRSVTMSESFLDFDADGGFNRSSSTAAVGANYGGGVSRSGPGGRYRLNGYLLELTHPGGQVERKSYCRVEDGFILVGGVGMFAAR